MKDVEGKLYVAFTMDCERIKKFSPPGGPETWELGDSLRNPLSAQIVMFFLKQYTPGVLCQAL